MFLLTSVHAHSSDTHCKMVVDDKVFPWIISLKWGWLVGWLFWV